MPIGTSLKRRHESGSWARREGECGEDLVKQWGEYNRNMLCLYMKML